MKYFFAAVLKDVFNLNLFQNNLKIDVECMSQSD